jgi:hypothetical protein
MDDCAWWVAGLLETPAVFSSTSATTLDGELPTLATTQVAPVAETEAGAV